MNIEFDMLSKICYEDSKATRWENDLSYRELYPTPIRELIC